MVTIGVVMFAKAKMFSHITLYTLILSSNIATARNANITINWTDERQNMDGFGAFAGRAGPFYQNINRDDIINKLFSHDGLRLSILRAEVMPSYSPIEGYTNFHADVPMDANTTGECFKDPELDQASIISQCGQLWILKQAQAKNPNIKFIASTWSPPYYMKTIPGQASGKNNNRNHPEHYDTFAQFLAQFSTEFKEKAGIPFYAISPHNEPDPIFQPIWDGAVWKPSDTAKFVNDTLKPAFKNLATKIIVGESANWLLADTYLADTLTRAGCSSLFGWSCNADIIASHGYSIPNFNGNVSYDTIQFPWLFTISNLPRWVTEACQTGGYNPGMSTAMRLAVSMHKFIAENKVSAYLFWLAAVNSSDESLINLGKNPVELPKVYDVFGLFSRYIRVGDKRIGVSKSFFFPNLYVSAFKNSTTKDFTIIAINNSDKDIFLMFKLNGFPASIVNAMTTPTELISAYETPKSRWRLKSRLQIKGGPVITSLPKQSVVTYTTYTP